MTKTSGRKIKCMTCGTTYNGGKNDHKPCPVCSGRVRSLKQVKKRRK